MTLFVAMAGLVLAQVVDPAMAIRIGIVVGLERKNNFLYLWAGQAAAICVDLFVIG